MSQPNTSDRTITKTETTSKTDLELAAALRAMALVTQDPSPIFELNVDCWEEIFDWLSVTDLHSFGQTCKFFHRIAGKYFEWKYRRVLVQVYNETMNFYWKELKGFNEFVQRLSFYDTEPDSSLLYASANCNAPNELKIVNVRSCNLDYNRLENMLASVEVLTFINLFIPDEFLESILEMCATNLRRLTIDKSERCDWMHLKYPKLQHLELCACQSVQELVEFFKSNPNVRSFSAVAEIILEYQRELMASNIELYDLTVVGRTTRGGVSSALIDLHKRGFFKHLHFATYTKRQLEDLPGLTTLDVNTDDYIDIPHLPTVTRFSIRPLWNGLRNWLDMEEVTDALPNLECVLMYSETSMEYICNAIHSKFEETERNQNGIFPQ